MRHLDYLAARIVTAVPGAPGDPTPTPSGTGGGGTGGGVPGGITEPQAPSWLNSTAVVGVLVFIFGLLIIVMAVRMASKANKGNVKEAASQSAVMGIATVWIIIGVAGLAFTMIGGLIAMGMNGGLTGS